MCWSGAERREFGLFERSRDVGNVKRITREG